MARKKSTTNTIDPEFSFEDTAIVMFKTSYLNYQMAMHLNDTFGLGLARTQKDLLFQGHYHAYYCYYDERYYRSYVLIDSGEDNSNSKLFDYYDKILLIRGFDAWEEQKMILEATKFTYQEPQDYEIHAHRQWALCNKLRDGIFDVDSFGFSTTRGKQTSLHPNIELPMIRKMAIYMSDMEKNIRELFSDLEEALNFDDVDESMDVPVAKPVHTAKTRIFTLDL